MSRTIILTGFAPFGNYTANPTEDLAKKYMGYKTTNDRLVISIVLPCTYFGAFKMLKKLIKEEEPYAVISTGLSSSVRRVRIESTFKNKLEGKYPDANGMMPLGIPIEYNAPKTLVSQVNHLYLTNILRMNKIPVEISKDADAYICNSLGYLTTKYILDNDLFAKNVFLHIPWTDDYKEKITLERGKIFLPQKQIHSAIELIIQNI